MKQQKGDATVVAIVMVIVFGVIAVILALMFGLPVYNVWQQELSGKAQLARANQSRQILVTQAVAEQEAAAHRAKAIEIMGEMAKKYPEYRQQEFIGAFSEAMHNGRINQIIYIPTEAGIPILEAGKR